MSLKEVLAQAEAAHEEAQDAIEEALEVSEQVPQSPAEFISKCDIAARLTVRTEVSGLVVGQIALEGDALIRRELARAVAEEIGKKLFISYEGPRQGPFEFIARHEYRGEVYVFTRAELEELVNDAMRAGRLGNQP